ncbi:hypothetical protein CLOM_g3304 [Closterium sp. NIES-68]|nr:hypothetical protein CLOM_g3304 [Closterium sp. NIES-68]GJP73100.1 hypothetical protein CLOP_g3847 [Closterium sp. NIES-67]
MTMARSPSTAFDFPAMKSQIKGVESLVPYPVALAWAVVATLLLFCSLTLVAVQLPQRCAQCDCDLAQRETLLALRGRGGGGAGEAESCSDWVSTSRAVQSGGQSGGDSTATPRVNVEDPWAFTKWTPRVSPCLVAGLPIEELDAHLNFRRGWTLGFVDDVEDKTLTMPFLRAAMDPSMHRRKRRVLIDLGANKFETSVTWFLRMYPLDFTEIHAVEVQTGLFQKPSTPPLEVLAYEINKQSRLRPFRRGPAGFPDWLLQRVHPYNFFISSEDNQEEGVVNVTRWLLDELQLKEEDSVVVKMDIEGAEWAVLPQWLSIPKMSAIVDELFVEVHYHHPSMEAFTWTPKIFNHTLDETSRLLTDLRRAGFYVHPWP